jgi:hypothetical protein|tara:strand:+ start:671 stop:1153 length:483 start_codon:yes stop_codon:yes gene_type:complete
MEYLLDVALPLWFVIFGYVGYKVGHSIWIIRAALYGWGCCFIPALKKDTGDFVNSFVGLDYLSQGLGVVVLLVLIVALAEFIVYLGKGFYEMSRRQWNEWTRGCLEFLVIALVASFYMLMIPAVNDFADTSLILTSLADLQEIVVKGYDDLMLKFASDKK